MMLLSGIINWTLNGWQARALKSEPAVAAAAALHAAPWLELLLHKGEAQV